jgi:exopolyphosphatase/guanosine-5'-triphosphate,3'-diphosphate pyrophosphatase
VLFCHARRPIQMPRWALGGRRGVFDLRLDGDWLSRHPLTQFLLEEESGQWDRVGMKLMVRPL